MEKEQEQEQEQEEQPQRQQNNHCSKDPLCTIRGGLFLLNSYKRPSEIFIHRKLFAILFR